MPLRSKSKFGKQSDVILDQEIAKLRSNMEKMEKSIIEREESIMIINDDIKRRVSDLECSVEDLRGHLCI